MKRLILLLGLLSLALPARAQAMTDAQLVVHLQQTYNSWRAAMIRKDATTWKRLTSNTRQVNVRNRIWSERRRFPDFVFASPAAPPDITKLKAMRVRVKGKTAKAIFFGKVDFGVGGKPTDNVFMVSYVKEASGWKYHEGEFVKLDAIPDVRKQLLAGDLSYFDAKDFHPDGIVPPAPLAIRGPVKYIAKTYVWCKGREVKLLVNKRSSHLYQNTKRSDVVIGGAVDGLNEMQFTIKDIPGGNPADPITLRVFLMSEIPGTQPINVMQYEISEEEAGNGARPKASGTLRFNLTPEIAARLRRR